MLTYSEKNAEHPALKRKKTKTNAANEEQSANARVGGGTARGGFAPSWREGERRQSNS